MCDPVTASILIGTAVSAGKGLLKKGPKPTINPPQTPQLNLEGGLQMPTSTPPAVGPGNQGPGAAAAIPSGDKLQPLLQKLFAAMGMGGGGEFPLAG